MAIIVRYFTSEHAHSRRDCAGSTPWPTLQDAFVEATCALEDGMAVVEVVREDQMTFKVRR